MLVLGMKSYWHVKYVVLLENMASAKSKEVKIFCIHNYSHTI